MDYYTNSGEKWSSEEENNLLQEYNEKKLDINEIGKIHKRTPGGISSKLAILGVISDRFSGRGQQEYLRSDLYKEICSINREKKKEIEKRKKDKIEKKLLETKKREEEYQKNVTFWEKQKESKKENSFICIKECDYLDLKEELTDLKIQLKKIKNMIKKLAIYEFDD